MTFRLELDVPEKLIEQIAESAAALVLERQRTGATAPAG